MDDVFIQLLLSEIAWSKVIPLSGAYCTSKCWIIGRSEFNVILIPDKIIFNHFDRWHTTINKCQQKCVNMRHQTSSVVSFEWGNTMTCHFQIRNCRFNSNSDTLHAIPYHFRFKIIFQNNLGLCWLQLKLAKQKQKKLPIVEKLQEGSC